MNKNNRKNRHNIVVNEKNAKSEYYANNHKNNN